MLYPTIQFFEQRAELLDIENSSEGLDDAIADLAIWMNMVRKPLAVDAWAQVLLAA